MKRILSGIKPTGDAHLGSYLGAMKHWAGYQSPSHEVFHFVADLHALNTRGTAEQLRNRSYDLVAWLIVLGINPSTNPVFVQSQVPAHAELAWILNNYATMGELSRMTQYKDKAAKAGAAGQLVALFDYPVLMAADILLYDADIVPIGDDQTQHVELTRDIAQRFNNLYGVVFQVPEFSKPAAGARIMMLDDPMRKMSKSEGSGDGCIYLLDDEATLRRKLMRAVTDSEAMVRYAPSTQPGVSNLIEILASLSDTDIPEVTQQVADMQYGALKEHVADVLVEKLVPLALAFESQRANTGALDAIIEQGRQRANQIATQKLVQVKSVLGLL